MSPSNPALERIKALKAKAGTGVGRSFDQIPTAPFSEPIVTRQDQPYLLGDAPLPNLIITDVRDVPEKELPPLDQDQDEARVAMRLIALQAEGVGTVAPTNVNRYNQDLTGHGQMDKLIDTLKEIDPRANNMIQFP